MSTTAEDIVGSASDLYHVKRVYGEPVERDGVTIIPAASIKGGGGGGGGVGHAPDGEGGGEGEGSGVGFGISGRPVGAWVISDGEVSWRPAIDVTRIMIGGVLIAVSYFMFSWLSGRRL